MNIADYEKDSLVQKPWEHYLALYKESDPKEMASRLSTYYDEERQSFILPFLGTEYRISFPDFIVSRNTGQDSPAIESGNQDGSAAGSMDRHAYFPLEEMIKARILTLRYFLNGKASKGTGAFRTYREMPWGEVYLRQFDGRCIKRLAFSYGNRIPEFERIMEKMGGVKVPSGDSAFQLTIYPGYDVRMILWEGDEEFPPSSQFLFSDNFPLSFEAEDIAQMGDVIIGSMKAWGSLK